MKQNKAATTENGFLGSISSSSIRNLIIPKSFSSTRNKYTSLSSSNSNSNPKVPKSNAENTPPADPNIINHQQSQIKAPISHTQLNDDPTVKVVVRIRPENKNSNAKEGDSKIEMVSSDTLCLGDALFTFDEVFDTNSSQEDVFQSVGLPLVRSALAGYNTSILTYGQSGSGKTYTMWGPPSSIVEEPLSQSQQGIAPRIFRMLFTELEREKRMSDRKQFNYQCRCSFLEICHDQIKNLLNPIQQNLEVKEDSKNALYIENLIEEYITSYDDVAQIMIKGLSNRKYGGFKSNGSKSHIIFTFVVESWCKGISKSSNGLKSSKISLIDLAGLDRDTTDDAGQYHTETINLKKSLSQLGHFVDALIKEPQFAKDEANPHRKSCLTHLLRDSLGGNSKLSVICSISPDNKSNSETLSTLRFGQRVRSVRNEPVINEIKEADVDFSDTIKNLKEELIRAKDDGGKKGSFQGCNAQESLNHLRISVNRSLILSNMENDTNEVVNVNEDDIRQLQQQIDELYSSCEGSPKDISVTEDCVQFSSVENCDADMLNDRDIVISADNIDCIENTSEGIKSVHSCSPSPILDGPKLSDSPKFSNNLRKNVTFASSNLGRWNNVAENSNLEEDLSRKSFKECQHMQSSLRSSKAESLATSLQRGLQIIDNHQKNSALNKSTTSFSFEHLTLMACPENDQDESSDQTIPKKPSSDGEYTSLCASCRTKLCDKDYAEVQDSLKVPKHLDNVCMEQAARIKQLNEMVEKLKDENKILKGTSSIGHFPYITGEECEIKEVQEECAKKDSSFDANEKEFLLEEIKNLRSKLQSYGDAPVKKSTDILRSSLMSRSIQLQKSGVFSHENDGEELENEKQRWTEMESEWICLTDELRVDLESQRQHAERVEAELRSEKKCTAELDDALNRAVTGHARIVEHYAELQEKYNDLVVKHEAVMEGIAEVKRAAAKASKKGHARFAKSLAAELSVMRVEREKESKLLKKENQILRSQLRDTAEAVQAAGELLVRLREAEHAASVAEENFANVQQDNEMLKLQIEKLKSKHKTEVSTMKQYLAESKLPESALQPLYQEDSELAHNNATSYTYDDQAWRAEFGASYHDHHYY
ncbi:hypothetical protein HN51_000242 [Arachis hypogaea]|uniref:Kinesin motor domain-containing protein n=1 Tax=Arachis hypogaea TaxID=3818 RepID=A0A445EWM9_ARAHY|nr:kinesin-like protein KIN-12F [Arachis hypogaea]QHO48062.1 uncharacterized protein DS421_1g02460 [Arachis hypogaea]RYR79838.1 hypothetical protein Ahy_A01g004640 [Arachis hypogaea]